MILKPNVEEDEKWNLVSQTDPDWKTTIDNHNPVTCVAHLALGQDLFLVGHASGTIVFLKASSGVKLAELGAHSRQISALISHPTRSIFASCADDTFVNIWEVTG